MYVIFTMNYIIIIVFRICLRIIEQLSFGIQKGFLTLRVLSGMLLYQELEFGMILLQYIESEFNN